MNLPAKSAQSSQILGTVKGLGFHLKDGAQLISPSYTKKIVGSADSKQIKLFFKSGRFKYLEFIVRLAVSKISYQNVYTRDILVAVLCLLRNRRVIYEAHQMPSIYVKMCMFLFRKAAEFKVACISDALENYYRITFGLENEKTAVIRSGVDLNKYISIEPRDLSIFFKDQTLPVLLHTGSLSEERGAQFLIDILRENCCVNLMHVGGSSDAVEKLIRRDDTGRLVALPHVDPEQLPAIQMGATALLFPMTSSTPTAWCCSPMKIFEYAATRVNLIATCPGAVSELINSANAYIVPENDAKAVGKALSDIMCNSSEAASQRSNLYKLARDWDYRTRAAAILEIFRK